MFRSAIPIAAIFLFTLWFITFQPIQVLPRIRLAPGFLLTDQTGASLSSEDVRGDIVLYSFAYSECGPECDDMINTLREVQNAVDGIDVGDDAEIRFVTISFDPATDSPEVLETYAAEVGADPDLWTFATADEVHVSNVVKAGFNAWYEQKEDGSFAFDPAFVLVDGWGVIRGEYFYRTNASDTEKLRHHLEILGEEIRNSHGAASLAYEAAHLFLCYP